MDALQRFSGPGQCPKCTISPANLKYCEKDCSRGESSERDARSPGGQFTSGALTLGSDVPPHLHRICRACAYEWLEQTADALPEGSDKACIFCRRGKAECIALTPAVVFLEGAGGSICGDCVVTLDGHMRSLVPGASAAAAKSAAVAH